MSRQSPRRGMALLLVSLVIVLVALAAYGYLDHMQSQYRIARMQLEQTEAKQAALSGMELCCSLLDRPGELRQSEGDLLDNAEVFADRRVSEEIGEKRDLEEVWRFSIVSPASMTGNTTSGSETENPFRYGMENECGKLHIPTLLEWDRLRPGSARRALLNLPGASEELVTIFLEYCRAPQQSPKQPTAPDRIAWLWNGGDWNHNYRLDPLELELDQFRGQAGRGKQTLQRGVEKMAIAGWEQFLTWDSGQRNENWSGQRRIFLNNSALKQLHSELLNIWPESWANFVVLARQYGVKRQSKGVASSSAEAVPLPDLQVPAGQPLTSVLDLIDAVVQIPSAAGPPIVATSPFSSDSLQQSDYLGRILDDVTLSADEYVLGVVDINAAPVEVLRGVPGMTAAIAQRCVEARQPSSTASDRYHVGWLLTQGICNLQTFRQLTPYLCARSDVYRIQVIGFRDELSPAFRATAVVDGRTRPARITRFQHWQNWGRF